MSEHTHITEQGGCGLQFVAQWCIRAHMGTWHSAVGCSRETISVGPQRPDLRATTVGFQLGIRRVSAEEQQGSNLPCQAGGNSELSCHHPHWHQPPSQLLCQPLSTPPLLPCPGKPVCAHAGSSVLVRCAAQKRQRTVAGHAHTSVVQHTRHQKHTSSVLAHPSAHL